jgi:hypothetical protein
MVRIEYMANNNASVGLTKHLTLSGPGLFSLSVLRVTPRATRRPTKNHRLCNIC